VVLSRTRPLLVQRLFEQEIPEIADGVIEVRAIAREPGYRSKVAVSSTDQRVDCVGACVGVRGNRIKNIVDELANERIDIVRWNDDAKELIPNALQPAEVDQVLLCDMIGRAIVLVREDQLSLAIGRKGQNVRLASKLCGWDIEIMTEDELDQQIERAVSGFSEIEGITEELAQSLVEQGYLSYDDLSVIEPEDLMEIGGLTEEQVEYITEQAEAKAEEAETAAAEERRRQRMKTVEPVRSRRLRRKRLPPRRRPNPTRPTRRPTRPTRPTRPRKPSPKRGTKWKSRRVWPRPSRSRRKVLTGGVPHRTNARRNQTAKRKSKTIWRLLVMPPTPRMGNRKTRNPWNGRPRKPIPRCVLLGAIESSGRRSRPTAGDRNHVGAGRD
jgi:transcription termination factor NusA